MLRLASRVCETPLLFAVTISATPRVVLRSIQVRSILTPREFPEWSETVQIDQKTRENSPPVGSFSKTNPPKTSKDFCRFPFPHNYLTPLFAVENGGFVSQKRI